MASGPVVLDPQELRLFAKRLQNFSANLSQSSQMLEAQFRQLGETWRDPAYAKFRQEFQSTMRHLAAFHQVIEETAPRLMRSADIADQVHGG